MELITVNEIAKLIGRESSAVYFYVKKGMLPKAVKKDKPSRNRYWVKSDVITCLQKIKTYQKKTNGEHRAKPKKKKVSVNSSRRPFETTGQIAANTAFNMCIN